LKTEKRNFENFTLVTDPETGVLSCYQAISGPLISGSVTSGKKSGGERSPLHSPVYATVKVG